MASTERAVDRGRRHGRQLVGQALTEFRNARVSGSISQAQVARALDRSDAWVSWTELGRNSTVSLLDLSAMLACVGLELSVRAYPAGRGLRDAAQLELLALFRALISPLWRWASEVPMPRAGDLRAWDAVVTGRGCSIGIEAETRIRDVQALDRRVMQKLRDSPVDRAIILVGATRTNRETMRTVGPLLFTNYPIRSREALAALRRGSDPGGNAVIVLERPRFGA